MTARLIVGRFENKSLAAQIRMVENAAKAL
jgi:hypothetical protein